LSLGLIAIMAVMAIVSWAGAPDRIPVHWDLSGTADRYGGKFEGLAGPPLLAIGIYLILLFTRRIDSRRAHSDALAGPRAVIRTSVVALIFGLYLMLHLMIRGRAAPVTVIVPAGVGLLFLVLGAHLPRVPSNWFVGVRTPWTPSSEESWKRTHDLAGWLFMAAGAATVATALLRPAWSVGVLIGGGGGAVVVSVVSSYVVWKRDRAGTGG
jgi:uncharacterized membrane protein